MKQVKFTLFSNLVRHHLHEGTVPPILNFNQKPPGFEDPEYTDILSSWNAQLNHSSRRLLTVLKSLYDDEIEYNGWLSYSLKQQCIFAVAQLNSCNTSTAKMEVHKYVEAVVNKAVDELTDCHTVHNLQNQRLDAAKDVEACQDRIATPRLLQADVLEHEATGEIDSTFEHQESTSSDEIDLQSLKRDLEMIAQDITESKPGCSKQV
uniref:Uncharacterized protein n=1 Tax=Ciona savignyi TaxID=51511 RepID=H2Y9X2_CIOSA